VKLAFHGCPMLQLGATGIEEEKEEEEDKTISKIIIKSTEKDLRYIKPGF
jgi:hypothetical protein